MNKGKVRVGIIGSAFQADIHAESFRLMPEEAEVIAIACHADECGVNVCWRVPYRW